MDERHARQWAALMVATQSSSLGPESLSLLCKYDRSALTALLQHPVQRGFMQTLCPAKKNINSK